MQSDERPGATSRSSSLWPLLFLGSLLWIVFPKRLEPGQRAPANSDSTNHDDSPKNESLPVPDRNTGRREIGRVGEKKTSLWEKLAVLVAHGLLLVNIFQMRSTVRSAKAAVAANDLARTALLQGERAHITVGRADGVVAEIFMPKGMNENAGIVVYFQDSGHMPAKFNWGAESPVIAALPADSRAIKEPYAPGA